MSDEEVRTIKRRLCIYDIGRMFYPGHRLGNSCRSPFRDDKTASFTVFNNGTAFHDFATSESGDVIKFYQLATGCSFYDAVTSLMEIATGETVSRTAGRRGPPGVPRPIAHPVLENPTLSELQAISESRNISIAGIQIAVDRDFLFTATIKGERAWLITDNKRVCYMARRLDGKCWDKANSRGRTLKSYTIPGSKATWPVGILETEPYPCIAVCEGGPDFLTAFHFANCFGVDAQVAPVCMSCSSLKNLPDEAWKMFTGKRVRIFAHADKPGQNAGKCWRDQIVRIAASVDVFDFAGSAKDLNELAGSTNPKIMEF